MTTLSSKETAPSSEVNPPVAVHVPERAIRVGYQGEAGAYSQRAVKRLFTQATSVPFHSVHRVYEAVEIGTVAFGVVPLENSHAGSINESVAVIRVFTSSSKNCPS